MVPIQQQQQQEQDELLKEVNKVFKTPRKFVKILICARIDDI